MKTSDLRDAIARLMQGSVDRDIALEDMQRAHQQQVDAMLRELIEVADGIARSKSADDRDLRALINAIEGQVNEALTDLGIERFRPAVGDLASGVDQEVMASKPVPSVRPGTITRVIRDGYRIDGRVIRRAGTEVAKG